MFIHLEDFFENLISKSETNKISEEIEQLDMILLDHHIQMFGGISKGMYYFKFYFGYIPYVKYTIKISPLYNHSANLVAMYGYLMYYIHNGQ